MEAGLGATKGEDGAARCPWGQHPPEYRAYHDDEWGRPVGDDVRVFEKLCLEGFQAGLSWLTILRKREAFRRAFAFFDPTLVAGFGEADIDRLLGDSGIVRHRGKIEGTIANARATVALRDEGDVSLAALVWKYAPTRPSGPGASSLGQLPSSTPESTALSRELRRRGFRFVGPTTVYSTMQSLGLVNDHLDGCHFRPVVDAEFRRFAPPH